MRPDIPDILARIMELKRLEVARLKTEMPVSALADRASALPPALDMAQALKGEEVRVIAEVKRASPSKGLLNPGLDPSSLTLEYIQNGAAAISVLTEVDHFRGSLQDLGAVACMAHKLSVPALRKDFIFDPYQISEARAWGADALLLIVAVLPRSLIFDLIGHAREYGMKCLVEVHNEDELRIALDAGAELVGINNRDLRTFKTDLRVTERLAPIVTTGIPIVSESGIHTRENVERLGRVGVNAVLVGEALVTSGCPGSKLRELLA